MNLIEHATFRSSKVMDEVVTQHIYHNADKLPESNRKVLRVLASHSLKTPGACRLKISTIAEEVGCSEATVSRAIKRLKDLHVIATVKGTKKNGIQGANIYRILNFTHEVTVQEQERKVLEREAHETPRSSKIDTQKIESESFNSFKTSFIPFVNPVINNVNAPSSSDDLKSLLRDVYQPKSVEGKRAFEELCKIGFGRLKQYMKTHNMPYLQMSQIIVKAMKDLVNKSNVKNQFAMYSAMIKRQVEQLFQTPVKPVQAYANGGRSEVIPDWFKDRNNDVQTVRPSTVSIDNAEIDFEAERQKILAKLGGN